MTSSNNMSGMLTLTAVTPVIERLFATFDVNELYTGTQGANISSESESKSYTFEDLWDNLLALCHELDLNKDYINSCSLYDYKALLALLDNHFKSDAANSIDFDDDMHASDDVDFNILLKIAKAFDDGHNLTAIAAESNWSSGAAGGDAEFVGTHFSQYESTSDVLRNAKQIEEYLRNGKVETLAAKLVVDFENVLKGVHDENVRAALLEEVTRQFNLN